jgi:hypothetical protein
LRFCPTHEAEATVEGLEKEWAEVVQRFLNRLAKECGAVDAERLLRFVQEGALHPEDSRGQPAALVEPV